MAPQFKKLTDCPENLREAIDWLIQVRHGGDGQGLENLANALKKLIEEAIKEANTSFQKRENELNCGYIPNNNSCCDELTGKIEEAKTSSNSSKLLTAESALKKHRDADHSLSEDTRQRALKDIADRRNQLTELNTSLGDFTDPSKCNTLLTNLCSGLEKFVGFDSATKGYDGTGIVYSDLDRLCDGVMAFLHGVLESVKDDDTVTTYDNNGPFETLVITVKKNMYSVPGGFNQAIQAVTGALKAWDKNLQGKIDNVVADGSNGTLTALKDSIARNIAQVEALKNESLDVVVTTMGSKVYAGLEKNVKDIERAIRKLDKSLQNKIMNYFEKIQMKVDHVKDDAKDDRWRMDMLVTNVDRVFYDLKNSVNNAIKSRMEKMKSKLHTTIVTVQKQVQEINKYLQKYVKELTEWIQKADQILEKASLKIEDILGAVQDGHEKNSIIVGDSKRTKLHNDALDMKTKAETLHNAYEQARGEVGRLASKAVESIEGLEDVYMKKLNAMKQSIDEKVIAATGALDGLKKTIDSGLDILKNNAVSLAIKNVITSFTEGVEKVVDGDLTHPSSTLGAQQIALNFQEGLQSKDYAPTLVAWAKEARLDLTDFLSALDNLNNRGNLGKFNEFRALLRQLKSFIPSGGGDAHGKTFFVALETDLKKKVKAAIDGVRSNTGQFHVVFSAFHEHITGGSDRSLKGKIENIRDQFKLDFDSSGKLNQNHSMPELSDKRDGLSQAIRDCESKGFKASDVTIADIKKGQTFRDLLNNITVELERIAGIVSKVSDSDGKGLKQLLADLKTSKILGQKSSDQLTKIKNDLSLLQSSNVVKLENEISLLLSKTLPEAVLDCMTFIRMHFDEQIESAIDDIKQDALNRYVTSKSKGLTEVKDFVEKQQVAIKNIIDNDLISGFKGMLRNLNNVLENVDYGNATLDSLATEYRKFFTEFFDKIKDQPEMKPYASKVDALGAPMDVLLKVLINSMHFDHHFTDNLKSIEDAIASLVPEHYGVSPCGILDALKKGAQSVVGELEKSYVSKYSCRRIEWLEAISYASKRIEPKLTENAAKCARVFLSIISTLYEQLYHLFYNCHKDWGQIFIDGSGQGKANIEEFKKYVEGQGYNTMNLINSENNGLKVAEKMTDAFKHHYDFQTLPDTDHPSLDQYLYFVRECRGPLSQLYWHLATYFRVCHLRIPDRKTYPCNIRDMLTWLCGLPYTRVYKNIRPHCNALLEVKDNTTQEMPNKNDKVINRILDTDLVYSLYSTIQISYSVLVAIQGHGRGFDKAEYPYAYNFCDNSRNFYYPSDVTGLFDMLREICQRLLRQLYFLYSRCRTSSRYQGWYECPYGHGVPGHQWVSDQPRDQPKCPQKSPLQAYLMDGLSGCLPHEVTSIGCKSVCGTCPKTSPGMPCITPMGFWDLSNAASVTRQGSALHNVLAKFCHNADSSLCVLLRSLNCLIPYPPKSLGDMYAFYCNVMQRWYGSDYAHNHHYKEKLNDTIKTAFPLPLFLHDNYDASQLTNNVRDLYQSANGHPSSITDKNHCDLWSINKPVSTQSEMKCSAIGPRSCASYLQPLGLHAHHTFAEKHASLYLSWCSYLAWDFWALLKSLLNAFKNMSCKSSGCSSCNCASGKHGVSDTPPSDAAITPKSGCHCKSIVDCKGVLSTFFQYGFTFRVPKELCESGTRKTCGDFVMQMEMVLQSKYFEDLFTQIDSFLFAIRAPFIWTTVALWLLSLLYLLHIMVIRLDLLHIKSHLHSPSSHRIAAQSLLAAGRVKALNKVLYLQP